MFVKGDYVGFSGSFDRAKLPDHIGDMSIGTIHYKLPPDHESGSFVDRYHIVFDCPQSQGGIYNIVVEQHEIFKTYEEPKVLVARKLDQYNHPFSSAVTQNPRKLKARFSDLAGGSNLKVDIPSDEEINFSNNLNALSNGGPPENPVAAINSVESQKTLHFKNSVGNEGAPSCPACSTKTLHVIDVGIWQEEIRLMWKCTTCLKPYVVTTQVNEEVMNDENIGRRFGNGKLLFDVKELTKKIEKMEAFMEEKGKLEHIELNSLKSSVRNFRIKFKA
jgi:hypothetical protein